MKLLIVFLILVGVLVFVQAEQNECYWHVINDASEWASCMVKG
jgi:hypothetical protein